MFRHAASVIREAEVFIITAGAGMGVDSGLPDFRGDKGFWNAYPAYARQGLSFIDCANPASFAGDPRFSWGFYGHRTNLYRETVPHKGFHIILGWIDRYQADYFVVTSNVDGQFQKAGYAESHMHEVHGSIHWLQCQTPCCNNIWANKEIIEIDETSMRACSILPSCPNCGKVSRPNILMFGDWHWLPDRSRTQEQNLERFLLRNSDRRIVVIEMGAGSDIPTIRATSEHIGWNLKQAMVVRINPREPEIKPPHISIPCGALEALQKIDAQLKI